MKRPHFQNRKRFIYKLKFKEEEKQESTFK